MFKLLVLYISLLTVAPGEELYARYGHTAVRVVDAEQQLDICFNYGLFDFRAEHFYYKFVRGLTYYQLGVEDTRSFIISNAMEGREVYEQHLNLSEEQAEAVKEALLTNYRPENREYLYNFVFDNCATRPYYVIANAIGDSILSAYRGWEGKTYRQILQYYTGKHSWADFGTNMLFGRRADVPMHGLDRVFLPEQLMLYLADAHTSQGKAIVDHQQLGTFAPPVVKWYETWYVGVVLFILLMAALSIYDRRRGKMTWWVDVVLGVVYVLLLAIVVFLTFFSIHPLVGFNWRLFLFPCLHAVVRLIYWIR